MYSRRLSLSDGDIDAIDGIASNKPKVDTLERHSHFFTAAASPRPPPHSLCHSCSYPNLLLDATTTGGGDVPEISIEPVKEEEPTYTFDNHAGLAHDLSFLAGLPELCDVTFLVGEDRQPVCGVRAILAARSR